MPVPSNALVVPAELPMDIDTTMSHEGWSTSTLAAVMTVATLVIAIKMVATSSSAAAGGPTRVCGACRSPKPVAAFSKSQLKKKASRRCLECLAAKIADVPVIAKPVEDTLNNIPDTPEMQKVCIGTLRVYSLPASYRPTRRRPQYIRHLVLTHATRRLSAITLILDHRDRGAGALNSLLVTPTQERWCVATSANRMRRRLFCSLTVQDGSAQTLSGPIAKLVEATLNNIPDTPKMQKVCIGTLRVYSLSAIYGPT